MFQRGKGVKAAPWRDLPNGPARRALMELKAGFVGAAGFSGGINLLTLSGSLFMLQVYDRVLPSRSLPTLTALFLLVCALYAFQSGLELIRSRVFARIGRNLDRSLGGLAFDANVRRNQYAEGRQQTAFRDLEQLRGFLSGAGPVAVFDLPWFPIYIVLLFLLHPLLGLLGLGGAAALGVLTWRAERATLPLQQEMVLASADAGMRAEQARRAAETVLPLGMLGALRRSWADRNASAGQLVLRASDASGFYATVSRFLRMVLQSAALAVGALLIIGGHATGGVMIASSILLGRALAPVEMAIAHWRAFQNARQAFLRLDGLLGHDHGPPEARLSLPRPSATLKVSQLSIAVAAGQDPIVKGVTFALAAGDGLGVIGPSGAGKSTLLRAIVGLYPARAGDVRVDGSTLDQWTTDEAGAFIGYMPQGVELFAGTVAQNISRFAETADAAAVLKAAELAGIDQLVRGLPNGFDTPVGEAGSRLSAGQRQRIALARALYGDPFLIVLDEPNAALDAEGEAALNRALERVRAEGAIVVSAVHRASGLQSLNKVLVLAGGVQQAFGPRDEVLRRGPPAPGAGGAHLEVVSS